MPDSLAFQLTRLMRGVTLEDGDLVHIDGISTHTPHARRDGFVSVFPLELIQFQLTRLMRGVTICFIPPVFNCGFQLTRLMRGVTTYLEILEPMIIDFNSHASCEA